MNIIVVGGTYFEECFEPRWREIYGSGLRGALTINNLDSSVDVDFYTFGDTEIIEHLNYLKFVFKSVKSHPFHISESITFKYDHPLSEPLIYPRLDTIDKQRNQLYVENDNIVLYGTIEGQITVKGNKVVYDPQSPVNPSSFQNMGNKANQLVIITNMSEAKAYSKKQDLTDIKNFFFSHESAEAIIIKDGPRGAYVFTNKGIEVVVPAYKTKNVWSIGSGDVFTAAFAYHWMAKSKSIEEAAINASFNTAQYCSSKELNFQEKDNKINIQEIKYKEIKDSKIYLAGPFFTFPQRWLIQQFREALLSMGGNVFSPMHDVGYGLPEYVVPLDIEAINSSNLMVAIVDGLDSGTLFEIGYARAKNIPVIAYVQNETPEALTMLQGTNCIIFNDFTTSIYNAIWQLISND